ncbi:WD40 repeat-like protein [Lentinus tigrinus ALCF2SS1-7]|uniref:WD40 repeat-like protein n=1 Tax=Lentinus tigrinus ALCF2SS1-6 TaxID=1328759 RepID=A0A5C2SAC6_9APHY|nr:WD40 repeat-like protein [Lentinus tigrinus ALCF2SS1-6]RPD74798.1 WD40 repeat-like protein [Lentinus tigrinus ALCF2SS1-7]
MKFVLGLSRVLESISLEIDGTKGPPRIDFSTLPQVQSLQFSLLNLENEMEGLSEIANILTDNLPAGLRKLTIIMPFVRTAYDNEQGKVIPQKCRDLEEVLSEVQLEGVTLVMSHLPVNRVGSWKQMFERVFPDLRSRGLLQVQCNAERTKQGHSDHVTSLQASTDHRWIASTSADGTIIAWSIDGEGIVKDTQLPRSTLPFALPCGDCFISSPYSSSRYVGALWDINGRELGQGCEMLIESPLGRVQRRDHTLITLSPTPSVKIYHSAKDFTKGIPATAEVRDLPIKPLRPGSTKFVMASHDGAFLAVAFMHPAQCLLWRNQCGQYVREDIVVSDESRSAITTGAFSPVSFPPYQHTFTLPSRLPDSTPRSYGSCLAVGFTKGAVRMLSLCVKRGLQGNGMDDSHYWELDSSTARRDGHALDSQQKTLYSHDGPVTSLAFSPKGTFFLSTSEDSTLKVLARNSPPLGAPVTLRGHCDKVHAACFSPDERYIASASEDRTVRVWRVQDWSCLATYTEHEAAVTHVVFCPEGGAVWSAARDGRVCRHALAPYIRKKT